MSTEKGQYHKPIRRSKQDMTNVATLGISWSAGTTHRCLFRVPTSTEENPHNKTNKIPVKHDVNAEHWGTVSLAVKSAEHVSNFISAVHTIHAQKNETKKIGLLKF